MNTLIDLLFDRKDLKPANINKELKEHADVVILTSLRSDTDLYTTELPQGLERQGLKVILMENGSDHQKTILGNLYVSLSTGEEELHFKRENYTYVGIRKTPDPRSDNLMNVRIKSSIFDGSDIAKNSRDELRILLNNVKGGVLRLLAKRS